MDCLTCRFRKLEVNLEKNTLVLLSRWKSTCIGAMWSQWSFQWNTARQLLYNKEQIERDRYETRNKILTSIELLKHVMEQMKVIVVDVLVKNAVICDIAVARATLWSMTDEKFAKDGLRHAIYCDLTEKTLLLENHFIEGIKDIMISVANWKIVCRTAMVNFAEKAIRKLLLYKDDIYLKLNYQDRDIIQCRFFWLPPDFNVIGVTQFWFFMHAFGPKKIFNIAKIMEKFQEVSVFGLIEIYVAYAIVNFGIVTQTLGNIMELLKLTIIIQKTISSRCTAAFGCQITESAQVEDEIFKNLINAPIISKCEPLHSTRTLVQWVADARRMVADKKELLSIGNFEDENEGVLLSQCTDQSWCGAARQYVNSKELENVIITLQMYLDPSEL